MKARRVLLSLLIAAVLVLVVALPALHLIARAFPDAERRMLTNFPVSVKAPAAAAQTLILPENARGAPAKPRLSN